MEPCTFIRATDKYSTLHDPIPAPILRKSFVLDFVPEQAELSISASGFYKLYINGQNITKGHLAPFISNPCHCFYYDTYDVAPYLQKGKNAVAIMLGNGWANQDTPRQNCKDFDGRAPLVTAMIMTAAGEGKTFTLQTDETFKVHASPILYDMYRFGVIYDARQEIPDFADAEFDDSHWENARLGNRPTGILYKSTARPILDQYEMKPVSIEKQEDFHYFHDNDRNPFPSTYVKTGWVYDFGYDCAGVCRLKIKGQRGQKVTLHHGETFRDGKFNMNNIFTIRRGDEEYLHLFQADTYILKGGEEEIFVPTFTYHGFRYVLVEGITPEQATEDLLTYIVFNTDLRRRATFQCSDPLVNTLYEMAIRSDLSNFHHFPTDCPTREKNGWTGDIAVSACQLLLSFDCSENFRVWMQNVRAAQRESGELPGVVPTCGWGFAWGNGPMWDSVCITVPYFCYQFDHREDIIRENSDLMFKYLQYIAGRRDENGLVACGLGDWCQPYTDNVHTSSSLRFTDSTQVFEMAKRAAFLFGVIGQGDRKAYALALMEQMRQAIRAHLINLDTMTATGACQTSQAVALAMGLFEAEEYEAAYKRLVEIIRAKDYVLDCGMIGLRYIFHVLFAHGDGDIALKMICREDAPSYANMIKLGGTALFESLIPNGIQESQNHHFYGDIINVFISRMAGLMVNPDFDDIHRVVINPQIPESISYAQASYAFEEGEIRVKWEKKDGEVTISVEMPPIAHGILRYAGKEFLLHTGMQEYTFSC